MDVQLGYIYKYNDNWLEQKLEKSFAGGKVKIENFNGLLGEIRAYGELLELKSLVFEISKIEAPKSGSDFVMVLNNKRINIEVNTPQESGTKNTVSNIEEKTTITDNYSIKQIISTNAPYGYPVREKDNIQYEAVSKFSQIKEIKEKKQFPKQNISILWLDLNNPLIFMFNHLSDTTPISSFNGQLSSGFIWNAFYSLKDDNVYSCYSGFSKDVIKMEFDGRFCDSNIDFVIIDCFTHKVIFENHNSQKIIPRELYRAFFQFHNFNNRNSYLSFNGKDKLKKLIKIERDLANSLADLYHEKC